MAAEKLFLPFNIRTQKDDVVIASPVYLYEALFSERRKFSPAKFFRRLIIVDASNGLSQITKFTKIPEPMLLDEKIEHYLLDTRITPDTAGYIAQYATLPYEERSFGNLLMNWKIYPKFLPEYKFCLGYIIRGNEFIDSFNCYATHSEKLADILSKLRQMQ